ncbi:GNAT family N-acetyltransferase [Robiginitalea sp.]|jgi:putative acetyltransferase|uniref:GNAT family N-acetyltransferase n=1 Tax=Robiginitalea sp. TaxID=1902411 RepID=UPI003C72D980
MITPQVFVRTVLPEDGAQMANIIRQVLVEFNVPKKGSAFSDPSMEAFYNYYQAPRSVYWVLTDGKELWGGGGLAPLENGDSGVCELQKMYFRKEVRGQGWGARILLRALEQARAFQYRQCYLETMPYMQAAQALYQRNGFSYLDAPMGNTGHTVCTVWMSKPLLKA